MQLTHGSKGYVSKPSSPLAIIQQLDRCGERFVWNNLDLQFDRRAPTRSLTNFFTMHYSTARSRRTALDPVLPSSSKASLAMTSLPRIRAAIVGAETREVLGNTRVRCGRKRSMKPFWSEALMKQAVGLGDLSILLLLLRNGGDRNLCLCLCLCDSLALANPCHQASGNHGVDERCAGIGNRLVES